MTRISTVCVLSGTLAVLAFSANIASAENITVHATVPNVKIQPAKTAGGGNTNGGGGSLKGGTIRKVTGSATPQLDREGSTPSVSEIVVTKPQDSSSSDLMRGVK